jgi:hypothetical protein
VALYSPSRDAFVHHLQTARRAIDHAVISAVQFQDEAMAGELTMMQAELTECIACVEHLTRYKPDNRQLELR